MKKFINIKWQDGTIQDNGVNGAELSDVLKVVLDKLYEYNDIVKSTENELTIIKIEEAIMWQEKRTFDRIKRNVEGTYEK